MNDDSDIHNRLSAGLRAARRSKGLSLDAVAKLSGVSRSMVSQIERGESSPTVATLWNLTRALQVDFAGLLEGRVDPAIQVVAADAAPVIATLGDKVTIRILSAPEAAGEHEIYDISFGPDAALISEPHRVGCREDIVVSSGRITITTGEESREIGPQDAAHYAADLPHRLVAGPEGARLLMIVRNS